MYILAILIGTKLLRHLYNLLRAAVFLNLTGKTLTRIGTGRAAIKAKERKHLRNTYISSRTSKPSHHNIVFSRKWYKKSNSHLLMFLCRGQVWLESD